MLLRLITFFTFERLAVLFFGLVALFLLLFFTVGMVWAWIPMIFVIFIFLRYLFLGTVGSAARKLQEQDIDGAQRLLNYTLNPNLLQLGMKGMYWFMQGSIDSAKQDVDAAEKNMQKALKIGLADNASTCMAYVNLSAIYLKKERRQEAKEYLHKAKKLKPTEPMLIDFMSQIEMALNAPKMNPYMTMMAQRGRGGFRRK